MNAKTCKRLRKIAKITVSNKHGSQETVYKAVRPIRLFLGQCELLSNCVRSEYQKLKREYKSNSGYRTYVSNLFSKHLNG